MKKTIIQRLGASLLAAALCITSIPADLAHAANAPANVSRVYVHDPSIIKADGTYYLFGSHLADAKSTNLMDWEQMNFDWNSPGRPSSDDWKNDSVYGKILDNLSESFRWAGYDDGDMSNGGLGVWAPDVIYNPDYQWQDSSTGAYMLYYSTTSSWRRSCIGYCVSKNPEGPYEYVDTIIYSAFTKNGSVDNGNNGGTSTRNTKWDNSYLNLKTLIDNGTLEGISDNWFDNNGGWNHKYAPNAIDPTVFFGKDGGLYMCYGSWSGGLFILELDSSTGAVMYPGSDSTEPVSGNFTDRYFGTHIAGGNHKSGEGPYILYDPESDYYYLYETYGYLGADGGYNMRLFRSKNVYGPYIDAAGNNAKDNGSSEIKGEHSDAYGIKLIGNYQFDGQPGYRAAGHNSAFIDDDGQRYLFHHQRFDGPWRMHEVRVRQQFLNEDNWPVSAVYEYRGEKIGHYNNSEIIGTYDLINHGTKTDGNMIYSTTLALYADGTVRGALEGTWKKSTAPGKEYDYITLNLGDTVYKGFLFKQFNEETTPREVMTFSVIGNNNTCLWGSKTTARKSLSEALVYGFDFETPATGSTISPVKNSKQNGKASLSGTASIVTDAKRGKVLRTQNSANSFQKNYLRLPADTFSNITANGFTVSMWVNIGTEALAQSALFEAGSGSKETPYPLTRISADLQPCINADENTDIISYPIKRNEWHHIAYSVDSKGIKLYLDGKLVRMTSEDLSTCFDASLESSIQKATDICVGSGLVYGAEDIQNAAFDDVSIYSTALSSEQITQIYSTNTTTVTPVTKSAQTISAKSSHNKTYGDKSFSVKATLTKGNGKLSYSSSNSKIAKVNSKGVVTIKNTGMAKITITASETSTYKKQTKTVTIKIAPKKTSLSTVKSKSAKKATLTWKTVKNASGYRIQYATNSKFKSARTVTVNKSKTKTKTISKLKRKKTYYFRIQPYKQSGKTKIYGAYSKAKRVKIK